MRSPLPPSTYLLAHRVVAYVVERMASDMADRSIREAREYLVRHALHLLTPHGLWAQCPIPLGEMTEAVESMVQDALVDSLARTVTGGDASEGGA